MYSTWYRSAGYPLCILDKKNIVSYPAGYLTTVCAAKHLKLRLLYSIFTYE
jgi:hypothetical protein